MALSGGLGGGKTTLARAVIRELAGDPRLEVPSPTFTLVQPYTARDGRGIIHADLYRLRDSDELVELGFDEMAEDAITLVEWPDRMPPRAGPVLTVDLSLSNPMAQMKQNFDDLGSALSSGNIDDAKKAFAKLQKNAPSGGDGKTPSEIDDLKKALDSGDLKGGSRSIF